jgi:vacuolar iron transporter family protein
VPLVPFMVGAGERAFGFAAAAAALSLFIVGMATSQLTGQPLLRGGLRLLVVGGGAGIVAYLIGKLLGVTV